MRPFVAVWDVDPRFLVPSSARPDTWRPRYRGPFLWEIRAPQGLPLHGAVVVVHPATGGHVVTITLPEIPPRGAVRTRVFLEPARQAPVAAFSVWGERDQGAPWKLFRLEVPACARDGPCWTGSGNVAEKLNICFDHTCSRTGTGVVLSRCH